LNLQVKRAENRNEDGRDQEGEPAELFFFARFHASPSREGALREALKEVVIPSREGAGCLSIHAFRSTSDPRLFFIHSRWKDEVAFEYHASLPHTVRFLEQATQLIDHALARAGHDADQADRLTQLAMPARFATKGANEIESKSTASNQPICG
jgi:quinol monooxygenase YgiN